MGRYVLITAARNEMIYIERLILSVVNQTVRPVKWLIINDGSTDSTEEIVLRFPQKYPFISLINTKSTDQRNFSAKVKAVDLACQHLSNVDYDFIGILDADVSLDINYYEVILNRFNKNPKLGLAGGLLYDVFDDKCIKWVTRLDSSVGGPVQFFRKKCFEEIGGFIGQEKGGEDAIAEFMARMNGWEVKTFSEIKVYHHRRMGTAVQSIWQARFNQGVRDYTIGYHPLFEAMKCCRRIIERPYFIGGFLWLIGYFWSALLRKKINVPDDVKRYIHKEQLSVLLRPLNNFIKGLF